MESFLCIVAGEWRRIAIELDSLDSIEDMQSRIHALLDLDAACEASDIRVYLAEKRRHRAWFRVDDPAVVDLRSGREPPLEFSELYLSEKNLLHPRDLIQEFIPLCYQCSKEEVHFFLVVPEPRTWIRIRVRLSKRATKRKPAEFVLPTRKRTCGVPKCAKLRRSGGFCIRHGGGTQCKADGCSKLSRIGGFCPPHSVSKQHRDGSQQPA